MASLKRSAITGSRICDAALHEKIVPMHSRRRRILQLAADKINRRSDFIDFLQIVAHQNAINGSFFAKFSIFDGKNIINLWSMAIIGVFSEIFHSYRRTAIIGSAQQFAVVRILDLCIIKARFRIGCQSIESNRMHECVADGLLQFGFGNGDIGFVQDNLKNMLRKKRRKKPSFANMLRPILLAQIWNCHASGTVLIRCCASLCA